MSEEQDLSAIFGPCAKHAEYQVGQTIRYRADGRIKQGEIDWITDADEQHPLEYWIGLECIYQTDIIATVDSEQEDTVLLVQCPYCGTTHSTEGVEWCRNRHKRGGQ